LGLATPPTGPSSGRDRLPIATELPARFLADCPIHLRENGQQRKLSWWRSLRVASISLRLAHATKKRRTFMKLPSVYLKMRVLGAIDTAPGTTRHQRILHVADMTFLD
jgi:hypothetical protein